jgi:tripartite-type tricarboxylate transporter receptor subunit TctC
MLQKIALLLFALCWAGSPSPALAQPWPSKPIKIIAPFPPGGSVDQVARVLGVQLTAQLGQTVIVENRGGASGSIGTAVAAKSAPDGYTFVVVFDTHGVNPSLIPNLSFDTLKDLAPVMLIGTSPMVLAANPKAPFKTFKDVVAAAKVKGSPVPFGSIGSGSLGHLAMTQLANQAGLEFNHVPYKGGGPLISDAIAGHVPLMIATVFVATPQIEAKALVPLAVTSAKRYPGLPNVPTVAEEGFPGFEAQAWWGFLAPAGTPQPIIARMNDELTKALKLPAVAEKFAAQGMTIEASSPDKLQSFIGSEIVRWAKVVRDNKISAGE